MADPMRKLDDLISVLKGERDERRQHQRARIMRRGKIAYGDGESAMRCFIIDISKTGARLRPAEVSELPDTFQLYIEHDLAIPCEVVYRGEDELGVSFLLDK